MLRPTHRRGWVQRWLGESDQSDKWDPCLIAALMPRSRREIRNGSILGLPKTDEATKPVGTEVTSQQPHARDRPAVLKPVAMRAATLRDGFVNG